MFIDPESGLPLPNRRAPSRVVIAHHIILTGYGHWLPNDIRGSGSVEVRQQSLQDLGDIHYGRKAVQPGREELKEFHQQAAPRLKDSILWFDEEDRLLLADALAQVISQRRYTVYACAILKNHVHLCVRKHRDDGRTICLEVADATRAAMQHSRQELAAHRIWAERPYAKFLHTPHAVRGVVKYIEENPEKEGLPRQVWPFVRVYDGWPYPERPRRDK